MLKCVPLPLLHICVGQNSEAKIFHLKREQTSFLIQKKSRAVHLKLVSPTLLLFIFTPVTTLHILSVQPSNLALLALQNKNNLQNAPRPRYSVGGNGSHTQNSHVCAQ